MNSKQRSPTVFVVDDDPSVRDAIRNLLRSVGHSVEVCGSIEEYLVRKEQTDVACLVLDVRLPGISGLEFQRRLRNKGEYIPIIFLTGHGDVPISVQAMKDGALEFLTKPFRDQELLDAIQVALERDRHRREEAQAMSSLRKAYDTLTHREREVMRLVVTGIINKQIAVAIGLSEVTVKVHRAQVMRKMNAHTLADLIRMADKLGSSRAEAS